MHAAYSRNTWSSLCENETTSSNLTIVPIQLLYKFSLFLGKRSISVNVFGVVSDGFLQNIPRKKVADYLLGTNYKFGWTIGVQTML